MSSPAISVVLPAYNCSPFIRQALDSLLHQTFTNFEIIVVNDGSTDDTKNVINTYRDERIVYIENERNKGLVYTLQRGITLARGRYIARMDADDVSLPERLELQKKVLDENETVVMIACTVQLIDEVNADKGFWKEDRQTTTPAAIKKTMPWYNCIAHPTIMIRKETALKYPYNFTQLHCEDYDLWLRLLADGLVIEKLPQPLLHYRVHAQSITGSILRKNNPFYKQYRCKKNFLWARMKQGRWGTFENKVLFTCAYDGIMGMGKQVKNQLKH